MQRAEYGRTDVLDTMDDETGFLRFRGEQEDIGRKSPPCGAHAALLQSSPLAHPAHIVQLPGREGGDVTSKQLNLPGRPTGHMRLTNSRGPGCGD
jgi:hypothetical protein